MKLKSLEPRTHSKKGLFELYLEQLKDLYDAELQLVKALPKMVKAASSSELKAAFDKHFLLTQEHVNRLERLFSELNEKPNRIKCEAMAGLVKEGDEAIRKRDEDPLIKDADLIASAQKVEHYEMAGYGSVRNYAQRLGFDEAVIVLEQTLAEEEEAERTLASISDNLLSTNELNLQQGGEV